MPPSSATAYESLSSFKPRDAAQVESEANTKYDIPGYTQRLSSLRGNVNNLQSSLEAVDPSVTGRTTGTFTTEGQRQALVAKERTPILTDLGKQQQALGTEQAGYTNAQSLASGMVSALMNQDQQSYQRLLDQYNAATAAEAAAEDKRRFDLQLADQQAARAASAASSDYSSYFNTPEVSTTSSSSGVAVDPADQQLFNQVFLRSDGTAWGDNELVSDYNATLKSANNGNARDIKKINLYRGTRPDLFGSAPYTPPKPKAAVPAMLAKPTPDSLLGVKPTNNVLGLRF